MSISARVSLRQVAARAGVSHSTVSLALRAHPSIPEATRARILRLVEEMGYRPDPMLTALNAYRRSRRGAAFQAELAWLNAFEVRDALRKNPDNLLFWEGAVERAKEMGFTLEEFWLHEPGMTLARLARIFASRQIQGVLLPPMPFSDTSLGLPWERFSVVALGYSHKPVFHVAVSAQYSAARLATRMLWERGYRRIGLFTWPDQEARTDFNFSSGFACECSRAGVPALVCSVDNQREGRERDSVFYANWARQTAEWIAREKPDALLLPDPIVAIRIGLGPDRGQWRAKGAGRPAVAVLAHYAQHPWFAGIDQNAKRVGSTAIDHLIQMIQHNERGKSDLPLRILVEGVWRDGESAPAAATRRGRKKI